MKRFNFLRLTFSLFILVVLSGSAVAQSADRDHPTLLKSNEITGVLYGGGNEYFYSLMAGPGELTITVDVKSTDGISVLNFELLDQKTAEAIICCEFAQADSAGQSGQNIKKVKLDHWQMIILHLTTGKIGTGTYRIRFSGAGTGSS